MRAAGGSTPIGRPPSGGKGREGPEGEGEEREGGREGGREGERERWIVAQNSSLRQVLARSEWFGIRNTARKLSHGDDGENVWGVAR